MIKCHGNHNGRQEEGDHRPVWTGLTVNKPDIFDVYRMIGVIHNDSNNNINNNYSLKVIIITFFFADDKAGQFLFQRLSIALQRFNAILLHELFGSDVDLDL